MEFEPKHIKEPELITQIDFNIISQGIDFKLEELHYKKEPDHINFVELSHHKIEAFHLHMLVT